jgi:tetratricopeptide (TPR) repeat protein
MRLACLVILSCSGLLAQTVVVLPFFNHSTQSNLDWIGDSISESVRDALASEGVLVLDRAERLEAYRRLSLRPGAELTHASILKIGESLDAQQVVYGFYELLPPEAGRNSKGVLRITARLLDLKRTRQSPELMESGALEDLAAVQAHLGWQTLNSIGRKNLPAEQEFLRARPAVRLDAVESYIRGLLATTPEQRHRFFTQAARLDQKYSQPCFQLGKVYWEKKDYAVAVGWFERVARTDPHYREAQFFLGLCRYNSGDFAGAEKSFELVAADMPLNEVFNDLGAAQDRRGNVAAAIATFQKALEGDDRDPDYHFNLGYALWRSGRFSEAVTSLREALARNPADTEATTLLGRALKHEGPRPGDTRMEARQRLKTNYDETAFRQLQAALQK